MEITFVVPGKGTVLFGLPDIELLDMLSVTCSTKDTQQIRKQIMHNTPDQIAK